MNVFKTPGVYVQEVSSLPASIAPVATAIPAFIGYTETATSNGVDLANLRDTPQRISSLSEYEEFFGGPPKEDNLVVTFHDTQDVTGALLGRVVTTDFNSSGRSDYRMYHAVSMYFANGGGPCWIVSVGSYNDTIDDAELTGGLNEIAKIDEPTLLLVPEAVVLVGDAYAGYADYKSVMETALAQCNDLKDRFTVMDVRDNGNILNDQNNFRNDGIGTAYLKYGGAYYPDLVTTLNYAYNEDEVTIERFVNGSGVAESPTFPGNNGTSLIDLNDPASGETAYTEAYNQALSALGNFRVVMPPSSSMAGLYARTDRDRGVWKAPANISVSNVVGPNLTITAAEQEDLNVDATAGKSINAIRTFTGKGTLVWGARTLAGNDNEWRYVPVRRLFIFIEESVKKASEFVVFEPNVSQTWLRVKGAIEGFLNQQWSAGALAGSTPDQAYFVNVGLGTTMTAQDILEGRMIVEIGIAAVRPAEFIILRFSHKLQES